MSPPREPGPDAALGAQCPVDLFWRANRAWVAAVLHAHRPAGVEVDDLLQEVAMALVRHADTLDLDRARPWLRRVAINAAADAARRARVRRRAPVAGPGAAPAGPPEGHALAAAMRLAPEYREPLLLSLRGLPQRVIAEVMQLPETTIETRLVRARRMVREALAPQAQQERVR
ncbi:MAG: sigma-70 family RNA polymerase sigma factor [Phycisphaerales bacterium JB039]